MLSFLRMLLFEIQDLQPTVVCYARFSYPQLLRLSASATAHIFQAVTCCGPGLKTRSRIAVPSNLGRVGIVQPYHLWQLPIAPCSSREL